MTQGVGYVVVPIAIRGDEFVRMHFPSDITRAEAEKVSRVILAYACDSGSGPVRAETGTGSGRSLAERAEGHRPTGAAIMTTQSRPDLAGLKALLEKATALPWAVDPGTNGTEAVAYTSRLPDQGWLVRESILRGQWLGPNAIANASLAFAAVNALPDLIADAEAMRGMEELLTEAKSALVGNTAIILGGGNHEAAVSAGQRLNNIIARIEAALAARNGRDQEQSK